MSHGITDNDIVLGSTKREDGSFETDWHGMTRGVEELNDDTVRPVLFDIFEETPTVNIGGIAVPCGNSKALIADLRNARPELAVDGVFGENAFVHLHTPKNSYKVIPNREVWNAAKAAIAGIDAKIERVFTLENLTKFGVSIEIGEREIGVKRFNGTTDKTRCKLNLITSHDGQYACEGYDSLIRIVCMNTLRWSREAAGSVGFKVYHTKNASDAMVKFPELLNAILTGRVRFKDQMEYFDSIHLTKDEALYLALNFIDSQKVGTKKGSYLPLNTQNLNAAESIQELFLKGLGNFGQTSLDLLNGVTEYYTSGDGTGQKADKLDKAYKADFGKAAEHKEAFVNFLMKVSGNVAEAVEKGRKLYVDAMTDA